MPGKAAMALWISFALLTAVAALAILRPFWRSSATPAETPRDIQVYRQQLQEIDDEAERGMLGKAEAEVARIEISRRLLAAADDTAKSSANHHRSRLPIYVLAGMLPTVTLSLYLIYGAPNYPAQPLAARGQGDGQSVEALVTRVEQRLQLNPDDGMGWNVIAPVYMRMERFADAAEAYRNASRLLGESAERSANLAEALILSNDGAVDEQSRTALEKAVSIDSNHAKARFWLAVADEQAGRKPEALAAFRLLLARDLPDAAKAVIEQRIAALEGRAPTRGIPQPGAGGVDAAQINQMVSGLAERLKQDGSDLNGWLMLVRAYSVLGRKDEAMTAIEQARGQFAGNNDALGQIDALAKSLGLPS